MVLVVVMVVVAQAVRRKVECPHSPMREWGDGEGLLRRQLQRLDAGATIVIITTVMAAVTVAALAVTVVKEVEVGAEVEDE